MDSARKTDSSGMNQEEVRRSKRVRKSFLPDEVLYPLK
jgi:hypothetical protein